MYRVEIKEGVCLEDFLWGFLAGRFFTIYCSHERTCSVKLLDKSSLPLYYIPHREIYGIQTEKYTGADFTPS